MLTITGTQLKVLEQEAVRRFSADLAAYIAERHGDRLEGLAAADIQELCRRSIERGRAFGFETKQHLRVFTEMGLILGGSLFELPTVRMLLGHPDMSGDEKICFLLAAGERLAERQQTGGAR